MSQKRLKALVRDLNTMMEHTPLNTDDYRALLEELRKAKEALKRSAPIKNLAAGRPRFNIQH